KPAKGLDSRFRGNDDSVGCTQMNADDALGCSFGWTELAVVVAPLAAQLLQALVGFAGESRFAVEDVIETPNDGSNAKRHSRMRAQVLDQLPHLRHGHLTNRYAFGSW